MNLRDLEYITAIDRFRSFGRAAEMCNVSQPALSTQVKKLEQRLGVEIFSRTNQRVFPTEAGAQIILTAKDVLRTAKRIHDMAEEYRNPNAAPLRIGVFPTLAPYIIPYLIDTAKDISSTLKLVFHERPTAVLLEELHEREIDVAMVCGASDVPNTEFRSVFKEDLLLAVSRNHPLANRTEITPNEIPKEEMLLLDKEHCLRSDVVRLCNDRNLGANITETIAANSLLTMSHYIAQGYGCTLIPKLAVSFLNAVNPNIHCINIADKSYERDIGLLTRKECMKKNVFSALYKRIRTNPPDGLGAY